ncbi:putative equilibrative nucleoside transporter [Helianthus anomalus]
MMAPHLHPVDAKEALVSGPEQNALGNILVSFLMGGIFVGVISDWLWLIGKGLVRMTSPSYI